MGYGLKVSQPDLGTAPQADPSFSSNLTVPPSNPTITGGNIILPPVVASATPSPPSDYMSRGASLVAGTTYATFHKYKDAFGFYSSEKFDPSQWGSFYPYRMSIQVVADDGTYMQTDWRITLPISPSELQIRMPFASQVTATLRGVLEEHNGVPFREISFSGTTGNLPGFDPYRVNENTYRPPPFFGTIFAGTAAAAGNLVSSISTLISAPTPPAPQFPAVAAYLSGLSQFMGLYKMLEQYALMKRGVPSLTEGVDEGDITLPGKASRLRLILEMYKENWFWVLTPREFTLKRTANDPHLYFYSFSATAWKRKMAGWTFEEKPYPPEGPIAQRPNGFQQALNNMRNAVAVVVSARNVISAIKGDIHRLLDPLRSTVLFLKEMVGAAKDMQDLPSDIKKDVQQTVIRAWKDIKDLFPQSTPFTKGMDGASTDTDGQTTDPTVLKPNSPTSADDYFNDPITSPEVGQIPLSSLDIPIEIEARMEAEFARCRSLLKKDFERYRQELISLSEELATNMGLGSTTYSFMVGSDADSDVSTVVQPINPLPVTDEQLDVLYALQNALQVMDALTASDTVNSRQVVDSLGYIAALANAANIPFNVPTSKFLVPVPYGASLETISMLYLQDPDRWSEISTLNGLLPPYIDETGFVLKFETNGSGNQFVVNSDTNLYIGQTIQLYSTAVPVFSRRISSIVKLTDSSILITVNGDSNLSLLTVAQNASMRAFLPGTTNSEQLIYIPGKGQAPEDPKLNTLPGINDTDAMVKLSGIDLLLTSAGDLIITDDGDTRLAYGMAGLVQALKLMIAVPKGTLLQHPGWGFGISPGTSVADITPSFIRREIENTIAQDNRFTGVNALDIQLKPPTLQIKVSTSLSGTSVTLPVSVQMALPS